MYSRMASVTTASVMVWVLSLWIAAQPAAAQDGLVAHWDFNEGQGDALHDRSGNGNDGTIHGAQWVKTNDGYALAFDGVDDYVDCGNGPSLDITGSITVEAWVYIESAPEKIQAGIVGKFYESYSLGHSSNGRCYWYISSGGNYRRSLPLETGSWHHLVGTLESSDDLAIATMALYLNGVGLHGRDSVRDHPGHSVRKAVNHGKNFLVGCMVRDPATEDPGLRSLSHFHGMIDEVKVYNRALSEAEITRNYNEHAEEKGRDRLDASRVGRFNLTPPYFYSAENEFDVSVDFWGLMPLPKGSEMVVTLARPGEAEPLQSCKVEPWPGTRKETGKVESDIPFQELPESEERLNNQRGDLRRTYENATFSLAGLKPGKYEVRAVLKDKGEDLSAETLVFQYPPQSPEAPSPAAKIVGPLPSSPGTAAYDVELCAGGGFNVLVNGNSYPVQSAFSYPNGGENELLAASRPGRTWAVTAQQVGAAEYNVLGRGQYYSIERKIEALPSHIAVTDKITNLTDADLGVIVNNYLDIGKKDFPSCRLGGVPDISKRTTLHNPTAFVAGKGVGFGLVAMDDVYVIHGTLYRDGNGRTGIQDDMFGLAPNASYTMSWSIYPVGSDDYFDFINLVRNDLGVNGRTGDGPLACLVRKRPVPDPKYAPRGWRPKYISLDCLTRIADDHQLTIGGIEFIDFPKERALIKDVLADIRKKYPDAYPMFHVAYGLYNTNRPDERYPDSRLMDKDGKQYLGWPMEQSTVSKARRAEGWKYYAFYPTMDNSFGKAMLHAVDVMMDEMGAAGVFADGLMLSYGSRFTYDCWDGHTVEIDPETKTVKSKYASVILLSQELLLEWCKKITTKGGAVLVDSGPGTLTFARTASCAAYALESGVDNSCKWVHLAPFPMTLSRTCQFPAPNTYQDILAKLYEGVLWYDYYSRLGRLSIFQRFYPITFEEIHSGFIKGKEKLVTALSDVYGWPGDRDLHFVDLSDGRGIIVPHRFLTTVDDSGVRTQLALGKDEIAVLKKIPVTIEADKPVNAMAPQYDAQGIRLTLHGYGDVKMVVRDGDFSVKPNAAYSIDTETPKQATGDGNGTLSFVVHLSGQQTVRIQRAQ